MQAHDATGIASLCRDGVATDVATLQCCSSHRCYTITTHVAAMLWRYYNSRICSAITARVTTTL